MKAVVGIFIAQDDAEAEALTNSLFQEVAQHWPTFAVEVRETTTDEDTWFREEYADPMGWNKESDPATDSDVSIYGAGST